MTNEPLHSDAESSVAEGLDPTTRDAPPGEPAVDGLPAASDAEPELTVEQLVESLETVAGERDGYLDALLRLQAEFENYRKAVAKRESDARERANEGLVSELLPILDACDGAVSNGAEDVAPIRSTLTDALVKQGLTRLEPAGAPFDPEHHEAVMHEPGEGAGGPIVAEVLRAGYQWKGRTLRPAMVRVQG